MELPKLNSNEQLLFNKIYFQGIQDNEKNTKVWMEYKEKHEKVKEGLKAILPELSMNCMVPLGKLALMKGKIVHTNEILVCIGDGYFVKYSNEQAIELCNRRINHAEEMLKKFEQERNLLELRQMLPLECGAFADDDCNDIIECWDDAKLENWRVEHRQKEKEYKQKLVEIKKMKKEKIETKDDLFKRLDQLELEEELADELNRLEEYHNFLDENSDEDEISEEVDSIEMEDDTIEIDEDTTVEIEEENTVKTKEEDVPETKEQDLYLGQTQSEQVNVINATSMGEHANHDTNFKNDEPKMNSSDTKFYDSTHTTLSEVIKKSEMPAKDTKINGKFEVSIISEDEVKKMLGAPSTSTIYSSKGFDKKSKKSIHSALPESETLNDCNTHCEKSKIPNRRVSFATPHFVELMCPLDQDNDSKEDRENDQDNKQEDSITDSDMEETITIDFKHSDIKPQNLEGTTTDILSPQDIYRIFCKPKSILKRTLHPNYVNRNILLSDENIEEEETIESEMDSVARSTYNLVVQDIQERNAQQLRSEPCQLNNKKRRISKFKLERENNKKSDT